MISPYLTYIKIAAVVLILAGDWYFGYHYRALGEQAAIAKAEAQAIEKVKAEDKITHDADLAAAQHQVEIQKVTNTVIRKVPVYITRKAVAACVIPRGFVELHNSSANGNAIPDATGGVDDAAPGVGLDTVATIVAANYGKYHALAQQVTDLQNWITAQQGVK